MDGVILDSLELALKTLMAQFPTMVAADYKQIVCGNFHEELAKFELTHARKSETEAEKQTRQNIWAKTKSTCRLYDGVYDFLKRLHEHGYVLTINTSALTRNCIPTLQKNNIAHLFDFVATAEVSKSKVEKFAMIKDRYGVDKSDMLFITDTLGDVREAYIADVSTVVVTWGAHDALYFKQENLQNLRSIVNTVDELETAIYTTLPLEAVV